VFEADDLTVAAFGLTDQSEEFAAGASEPGTAFATLDPAVSPTRSLVEEILDRAETHDPDPSSPRSTGDRTGRPNPERSTSGSAGGSSIDQGVDVVHGHSAHVLQGVEVYRGPIIIYDAGDFVDDYVDYIDRGGVQQAERPFELVVRDGDLDELVVEPTAIVDEAATLADDNIAEWVRDTLVERSEAFGTEVERRDARLAFPLGED